VHEPRPWRRHAAPDKLRLRRIDCVNIAIVVLRDMLSAHQPFERFPRSSGRRARNARRLFAGGVPAMCDGVT
jgi:hypothetical protein